MNNIIAGIKASLGTIGVMVVGAIGLVVFLMAPFLILIVGGIVLLFTLYDYFKNNP